MVVIMIIWLEILSDFNYPESEFTVFIWSIWSIWHMSGTFFLEGMDERYG